MFQHPGKRARRRGWPISAYVGPNGSGKSAAMVWDTIPSLNAGRPVLSTVRLLDFQNPHDCPGCDEDDHVRPVYGGIRLDRLETERVLEAAELLQLEPDELTEFDLMRMGLDRDEHGVPIRDVIGHEVHKAAHPLWVKFEEWGQLLAFRGGDVLMDEVTGVGNSRDSQAMPTPVQNTLVQLRRRDVTLRWSAPAWARADVIIRETSQAVTYCQGYWPKSVAGTDRLWRQRRLFRWKTFDATLFEDFTAGKREELRAMVNDWHWGPKSPVFSAYDTYDAVSSITTVSEGGTCWSCGGSRRRPQCKCGNHHQENGEPTVEAAGPRVRGAAGGRHREPVAG